jgi:hypothetical protein
MPLGLHFNPVSLSNELRPIFLNNWSMTDKKAKEQTQSPRTLSDATDEAPVLFHSLDGSAAEDRARSSAGRSTSAD